MSIELLSLPDLPAGSAATARTVVAVPDPAGGLPVAYKAALGGMSSYTLPPASTIQLGGVKQGTGVTIANDGTLSATGAAGVGTFNGRTGTVTLMLGDVTGLLGAGATARTNLGLAAVAASGAYSDLSGAPIAYALPQASTTVLGGVKVDGTTITINASTGVISGGSGGLTLATTGLPVVDGTAALGVATTAAHADHVHPTDTSRAAATITISNTYTAAGAVAVTDSFALLNSASAIAATLASGAVDGKPITLCNYGAGTVTLTVASLMGAASVAVTMMQGAVINLFWSASLNTYLYAS